MKRTKKYWENRFNNFCHIILGREIEFNQSSSDHIKEEIVDAGEFFKEQTECGESSAEEIVLYFNINHELNLFDPIRCCYPSIRNEYSSYAWQLVDKLLNKGKEQFPSAVKKKIISLYCSLGNNLSERDINTAYKRIIKRVHKIYDLLDIAKKQQNDHFNENQFWEKQLKVFQYQILGGLRKKYAASITFLKEERDELIRNKEEYFKDNYEEYIQFLYINHHLNLLDPTEMYYPQFHYQFETYAWEVLKIYKNINSSEFQNEAEKLITNMIEVEGCEWKQLAPSIYSHIREMHKEMQKINK